GRDRGPADGRRPGDPRARRFAAAVDRGGAAVGRDDPRRIHPERRGPDRGARGERRASGCRRGRRAARRPASRPPVARRARGHPVRITRLVLRDFRRYRELEIPLAPGLTIVHGPNEAGKTTIQRAIELALTRKVTSGGADMDALRSWDAAEDARPVINLEFEIEDEERGVRAGSLEKAFRGSRGTVRLEVDGE